MKRTTCLFVAFAIAFLLAPTAVAQTSFPEVTPTTGTLWVTNADEDFWVNAVAPADVDGDGDIDFAVLGFYVVYFGDVTDLLVLFMNDGPDAGGRWLFADESVPLGALWAGASDLAWGDFDNDGDPDLAVGSEGATALYRNDGGTSLDEPVCLPIPKTPPTKAPTISDRSPGPTRTTTATWICSCRPSSTSTRSSTPPSCCGTTARRRRRVAVHGHRGDDRPDLQRPERLGRRRRRRRPRPVPRECRPVHRAGVRQALPERRRGLHGSGSAGHHRRARPRRLGATTTATATWTCSSPATSRRPTART